LRLTLGLIADPSWSIITWIKWGQALRYLQWLLAGLLGIAAHPAIAAPRYLDDCVAPDSTTYLRIESCTFSLAADGLDDKQRVQALLSRAKGYAAQFWADLASADLAEAKRLAPDDPAVSAALADVAHFIGGKQDRAIAGYKEVLQQGTADPATLIKLGMSYVMANKFDLARQTFDKAVAADPDNVEALIWRSSTYAHDKQYDLALADLDRAVMLDPKNATARQWRGEELLYAGAFEKAIDDLNFMVKEQPGNPLYRLRGIAEYMTGNFAAAGEDFYHDLNFDPVYAHLAVWRFFAEQRQGGDGAPEMHEIATLLNGRWPAPLLKLVVDQATIEDVTAAVAATKDPTLRQVRESQAHCIIGEWLVLKGKRAEAAEHFKISGDLGVVTAMDEVKERRAVVPPDTLIEFALARARLKEPVQ
jgi:tetratricopeptide (TPR) repeat protein